MKENRTVNVFLVAAVTGGLYGGLAVIFAPLASALMLSWGAVHTPIGGAAVTMDSAMLLAISAPLISAAMGFVLGGTMAWLFNMFVKAILAPAPAPSLDLAPEEQLLAATASFSDVA